MGELMKNGDRYSWYAEMARNHSYFELLEKINERLRLVYNTFVKLQPCSSEQVARELGVYPHTISPRTQELRWLGLIENAGMGISESGRPCVLYRTVKIDGQIELNFNAESLIMDRGRKYAATGN